MEEEHISNQDRRLQKILFLLKKRDKVTVHELSVLFSVSLVTIRADLAELERQGLVLRNYGGASLIAENGRLETSQPHGGNAPLAELPEADGLPAGVDSHSIARLATDLIVEGDSIFLDSSPEAKLLASLIKDRRGFTVLTTSLEAALSLSRRGGLEVHVPGGRVSSDGSLGGMGESVWPFGKMGVTKAFVSAWGATVQDGFGERHRDEADFKRMVLAHAGESYIFLRSSRWGARSLCSFAPLDEAEAVLTDAGAGASLLEAFSSRKVRVIRSDGEFKSTSAYASFRSYLRNASEGLPYQGAPGKGKRLAFANGKRDEPFSRSVEAGVLRNAALAGFAPGNILILDNQYNPERAVENAREIAKWGADVVVEFNTDVKSNNRIADIFREASIPAVAMEGSVPSAPFVGANNWRSGSLAGDYARALVESKLGGWDAVDAVILVEMSAAGELVLLRTEAFAASLEAAFGDGVEDRIVRVEGGNQYDIAHKAVEAVARSLDRNGRYVLTAVNAEAMLGAVDALSAAGVWSADRFASVVHGAESSVRAQLGDGIVDAAVLYHPERYGDSVIPAVCATLSGAAIPPYTYIDSSIIAQGDAERT